MRLTPATATATAPAALCRRLWLLPQLPAACCLCHYPVAMPVACALSFACGAGFVYATIEFTASLNLCLSFRFLQCHINFPSVSHFACLSSSSSFSCYRLLSQTMRELFCGFNECPKLAHLIGQFQAGNCEGAEWEVDGAAKKCCPLLGAVLTDVLL